jgi:hypothetical protein
MVSAIKRLPAWIIFILGLLLATAASAAPGEASVPESLIDDFSQDSSALGTSWEGFTDRVMGGRSDMSVGFRSEGGQRYLAMSGTVSLANNGGFIQTRLLLAPKGKAAYDASGHSGLKLVVRGTGEDYYLFLRTSGNVFPWSFFMARLPVTGEWQEVLIPWSQFQKGDYGSFFAFNPAKLASVAVVAYKKAFNASLDVKRIAFY